jgi:hypothetical protein
MADEIALNRAAERGARAQASRLWEISDSFGVLEAWEVAN